MKLLLTSGGVTNDGIAVALEDLAGKAPADIKVAFVPTAAIPDRGDKGWLINDLHRLNKRGYTVDIIEITALTLDQVEQAFKAADVIFFGGGNTFYLSYWLQRSGLFDVLPELLEGKVYAGISAGSMVAGSSLVLASQAQKNLGAFENADYDELGPPGESDGKTLHFVDLIFRPHLNSRQFKLANEEVLKAKAAKLSNPTYALDDQTALKIVDGSIEVVGDGEWRAYNTHQLS